MTKELRSFLMSIGYACLLGIMSAMITAFIFLKLGRGC